MTSTPARPIPHLPHPFPTKPMDNTERLVQERLRRLAVYPAGTLGSAAESAQESPARTTATGFQLVQNIYANETSYSAQQREAEKRFQQIARKLGR